MAYLEINNVHKQFGDFIAVDHVSFTGEKGEFITLLGPSGCGKTTLLKSIAGFYELDTGDIVVDGECINSIPPEQRDTAMCFQSYALFPHLSVQKNVAFGLEQKKIPRDEIIERVSKVLKQVSLETQEMKLPSQLSGGQQQRVALARAMVTQPSIILFDEPLSNLDAKLREQVRFEIRRLQNEMGFTALYVTHDQSEALALSDKIVILNKGKIQQIGIPEEIYNYPINSFVADFIGTANIVKAKVLDRNGEQYTVETPLGSLIVHSERKPQADNIYIGWRPEYIEFENYTQNLNKISAKVLQRAFLGSTYRVLTDTQTELAPVTLEVSQRFPYKENETFEFSILANKIFFLEEYHE